MGKIRYIFMLNG